MSRIAIVGAGRIGSTFGLHLSRAGHDVTMIARGARLEALLRDGAIVAVDGTRAKVSAAEQIDPNADYDLLLVTVLAHQVDGVLPSLAASRAPKVLFMFNAFVSLAPWRERVGADRFEVGFPNMMAFFDGDRLKSKVDGPGMVTTLSSAPWAKVLRDAGMPSEVEADMESYLKSHAAMVVPVMVAASWVWKRDHDLTWTEARRLVVAWREAFARTAAVKDLGGFGPSEPRELIDAMVAASPSPLPALSGIRP